jgi:hypothetical protein
MGESRRISGNLWRTARSHRKLRVMEKKWWTLVVVCAATFMLLLDITIVIVEQPPVAAGDGLLGGSEGLGQSTERGSGVDVQSVDDLSV